MKMFRFNSRLLLMACCVLCCTGLNAASSKLENNQAAPTLHIEQLTGDKLAQLQKGVEIPNAVDATSQCKTQRIVPKWLDIYVKNQTHYLCKAGNYGEEDYQKIERTLELKNVLWFDVPVAKIVSSFEPLQYSFIFILDRPFAESWARPWFLKKLKGYKDAQKYLELGKFEEDGRPYLHLPSDGGGVYLEQYQDNPQQTAYFSVFTD
jgi:hypothetical protein